MTDRYKGLDTIFGTFYPKGFVVALFDALADRDEAATELHNAGFSDVRTFSAEEVIAHSQELEAHRNALQRLGSALAADEWLDAEDYLESAQNGDLFLIAKVPREHAAQAQAILFTHNAHGAKLYGDWAVMDLMQE